MTDDTTTDSIADLPDPICDYCGTPIEGRDQQCPARDDGRCHPNAVPDDYEDAPDDLDRVDERAREYVLAIGGPLIEHVTALLAQWDPTAIVPTTRLWQPPNQRERHAVAANTHDGLGLSTYCDARQGIPPYEYETAAARTTLVDDTVCWECRAFLAATLHKDLTAVSSVLTSAPLPLDTDRDWPDGLDEDDVDVDELDEDDVVQDDDADPGGDPA